MQEEAGVLVVMVLYTSFSCLMFDLLATICKFVLSTSFSWQQNIWFNGHLKYTLFLLPCTQSLLLLSSPPPHSVCVHHVLAMWIAALGLRHLLNSIYQGT